MNRHVTPVLVAILILTGTGLASQAFAETVITINTDKSVYDHTDTITITGTVFPVDENEIPVTWAVVAALLDSKNKMITDQNQKAWYAPDILEEITDIYLAYVPRITNFKIINPNEGEYIKIIPMKKKQILEILKTNKTQNIVTKYAFLKIKELKI